MGSCEDLIAGDEAVPPVQAEPSSASLSIPFGGFGHSTPLADSCRIAFSINFSPVPQFSRASASSLP